MINYHKQFRQTLLDAAHDTKVYYETFDEKVDTPCISYMEISNVSTAEGDTLRYSLVSFQVKIWAETIEELENISISIDKAIKDAGFRRVSATETKDERLLVKILRYDGNGFEKDN